MFHYADPLIWLCKFGVQIHSPVNLCRDLAISLTHSVTVEREREKKKGKKMKSLVTDIENKQGTFIGTVYSDHSLMASDSWANIYMKLTADSV